jgi:hypothetical protein
LARLCSSQQVADGGDGRARQDSAASAAAMTRILFKDDIVRPSGCLDAGQLPTKEAA